MKERNYHRNLISTFSFLVLIIAKFHCDLIHLYNRSYTQRERERETNRQTDRQRQRDRDSVGFVVYVASTHA